MNRVLAKPRQWKMLGALAAITACAAPALSPSEWLPITSGGPTPADLVGVWENRATGHWARFTNSGVDVYHVLDNFCTPDTGLVPAYSLYRASTHGDSLELHHYDYRDRPELLQAPQVFGARDELPSSCDPELEPEPRPPTEVFALVVAAFDRFYAFFDERSVQWSERKAHFADLASELTSDAELFDLLSELLSPLNDGHVNVTWSDRSFNSGRPELRARLREHWKKSETELEESEFVSTWHRNVLESVYEILDAGSRRSKAAGAVEWGTIQGSVGYIRINRFSGFTRDMATRPVQYAALDAAMEEMMGDLDETSRLIVDVAMNGGGSDAAAQIVASYFADARRAVLSYEAEGSQTQTIWVSPVGPGERRPVLLLSSEITASAAESFVLMMRGFPHVTHVGGRTRGGLSSLLPKPFPNGLRVTFSYQRVLDSEGRSFEGAGIPPHSKIELFPDGKIQNGLADAIRALTQHLPATAED